jgi:DNA-binding NarL/FixJ family response regulator
MSNAKLILLIDDHDKDRQYYAHRLKVSSPDRVIFEAPTGQAGLDLFKAYPIDCVILELALPDISGFVVLAKLIPIARRPQIPVVVLTEFSNQGLLEVAVTNGAFVSLPKITTCGDALDQVVHKAIATIPRDGKKDVAA